VTPRLARQHLGATLGLTGAALGLLAGVTQATIGARIPQWTGAKQNPVALGVLTIVASLVAGGVAAQGRAPRPIPAPRRAAVVIGLVVPAGLCFSTVGRLWYLPGLLLLAAGGLTLAAGGTRELGTVFRTNWARGLVTLLGAFEVLMAVSATPPPVLATGVAGGLAVMVAPWLRPRSPNIVVVVLLMGPLPFAILTWWSIATPLVALLALAIGLATFHDARRSARVGLAPPVAA